VYGNTCLPISKQTRHIYFKTISLGCALLLNYLQGQKNYSFHICETLIFWICLFFCLVIGKMSCLSQKVFMVFIHAFFSFLFFFFFFFFGGMTVWTQGLMLARQSLLWLEPLRQAWFIFFWTWYLVHTCKGSSKYHSCLF
jgi:hypothetical protein